VSDSLVTNAGIQLEIGPNLRGGRFGDAAGNVAGWILKVAKQHGAFRACFHAGRLLALVDPVDAQCAGFDATQAARHFRILLGEGLVDK